MLDHLTAGGPRNGDDSALATLTPREREVLVEIAQGFTNPEIARRLYLSTPFERRERKSGARESLMGW